MFTINYGGVMISEGEFGKLRDDRGRRRLQGADHLILKTALFVLNDAEVHRTTDKYFNGARPHQA